MKRTGNVLRRVWPICVPVLMGAALLAGCPQSSDDTLPIYNNTADPTNNGATYLGSAACASCHAEIAATNDLHGHTQALKRIQGVAPDYPAAGTRTGVPNPPTGFTWSDISYVISGYLHGAFFVDMQGFILTDGTAGTNTQWNLDFPPTNTSAGFVTYLPNQVDPLPYDYDTCFRCHTTGPQPLSVSNPESQDGRPGILGTWTEVGVQCEACHGPGSNHVPNPAARDLFVDKTAATCDRCHLAGDDKTVIVAADSYVNPNTQSAELLASGGHARFRCIICHNPHVSTAYDRANGVRNTCTTCHVDATMAGHKDVTFVRGDYTEPLTCESCHMPFTGRSTTFATANIVGTTGVMGDVRSHIFRVETTEGVNSMFTPDGTQVRTDGDGLAAVTVDFVCLRCHTQDATVPNSAFPLDFDFAREIAGGLHRLPE